MAISGSISKEGDKISVTYSGGVQSYSIPFDGLYMLETYGAGSSNVKGGYAKGYKAFTKGQVVYICCGGKGASATSPNTTLAGGYNGGGSTAPDAYTYTASGGNGATHMALVTGTLSSIGKTQFVTNGKGLIVAGGSGGYHSARAVSGTGGGTNGGQASTYGDATDDNDVLEAGSGGTQSSGGQGGEPSTNTNGSFGKGGNGVRSGNRSTGLGGGGGYYGGGSGSCKNVWEGVAGGGGGSGWTGGVPAVTYKGVTYSPSMTSGHSSANSNGFAYITLIKKGFPEIKFNDITLSGINFNGTEISEIVFNGVTLT